MDPTLNNTSRLRPIDITESINRIADALNTSQSSTECRSGSLIDFKRITHKDMPLIWNFLKKETGRTTDFSYGGILMWIDYFHYEYAILNNTLFLKGVVENNITQPAFSLPIGEMALSDSVRLLIEYCKAHCINLVFSAVPEYALDEFLNLHPSSIEELTDWSDYLYPIEQLATLSGKKMSKKRNHVHQFLNAYPDWHADWITPENASLAMDFMDIFDTEGDSTEMAVAERALSRSMISLIAEGDTVLEGLLLYADGKVCGYTIGDVKGDTLFVHIEKATRHAVGSYEMINNLFAERMLERHPELKFVNREDDSGDEGLRLAKESYHPVDKLKKFNIIF